MSEVREIAQKFKKGMAMVFGGGPTLASSANLLLDAIDEFEPQR